VTPKGFELPRFPSGNAGDSDSDSAFDRAPDQEPPDPPDPAADAAALPSVILGVRGAFRGMVKASRLPKGGEPC
jgi:hypothetical protein